MTNNQNSVNTALNNSFNADKSDINTHNDTKYAALATTATAMTTKINNTYNKLDVDVQNLIKTNKTDIKTVIGTNTSSTLALLISKHTA